MGATNREDIHESLEELKRIRRKQTKLYLEKRALFLLYLKEGRFANRYDLSNYMCLSYRTTDRWLNRYHKEGLEGFLSPKKKEVPSKFITESMHNDLAERLVSTDDPLLSYTDAQSFINSKYDKDIGYHVIRDYMRNHLESRIKRPRKSHLKKDAEAAENFLKTTKSI